MDIVSRGPIFMVMFFFLNIFHKRGSTRRNSLLTQHVDKRSSLLVADFVNTEKQFEVEDFDTRTAQVFIAFNLTEDQLKPHKLEDIIHKRLHNKGPRPQKTTEELMRRQHNNAADNTTELNKIKRLCENCI